MISLPTEALEALLEEAHAALRAAGEDQRVWPLLGCTCGRTDCEIRDPARHTLTLQLDAPAAYWREEEADGAGRARLAAGLRPLGGLLDVPTARAETAPEDVLHHVRDAWLSGMGTPMEEPPGVEWLDALARVEARNAMLLEKLLERLAGAGFGALAAAGAEHARRGRSRVSAEGRAGCARTLRAWTHDHDALPQRTLLREHLLALLQEAPWSAGEAQDVFRMAEDAATALLAFGIADDLWVRAAYGAAEAVAPFAGLRAALVLEDDPVARLVGGTSAVSPPAWAPA